MIIKCILIALAVVFLGNSSLLSQDKIVSVYSGKALSIIRHGPDGERYPGDKNDARLCLWDYHPRNAPEQQWKIISTGEGKCKIVSVYSGKALSIIRHGPDGERYPGDKNDARLCLWDYHSRNAPEQQWKIISTGEGKCKIVSVYSGKALSIIRHGPDGERYPGDENDARLCLWDYHARNAPEQQWKIISIEK